MKHTSHDTKIERLHKGSRILIIEARYYAKINDMLLAGAREVFEKHQLTIDHLVVPGAMEIPAALSMVRKSKAAYEGYLAIGCIIRGDTYHFELVSQASAFGLSRLAEKHGLAMANVVLTVENEMQAIERADPLAMNKGGAGATTLLRMMSIKQDHQNAIKPWLQL